ncbi:MAG: aminotransferase class I/II-fold pyridoxal phosphate-dependent enzyme [Puniceicoccales bacterium]|jgi:LL-diaminopimelate aminotransferase|nr:aminotransferase class I/II-fold pyridoxal phosphate-dependent enzyme [Puniceicoccales bacterium]
MNTTEEFAKRFFSTRIGGGSFGDDKRVYKFEKIKRAKRRISEKFPNLVLVDMGVGEPDGMAVEATIEALASEARKYENRGYADNGCGEFKDAAAAYMRAQFGVSMVPQTEIVHSIGSKAALSILPYCFVDPGDVVLTTAPGYQVFATHAKYLLADVVSLPLRAKGDFLPDLTELPAQILKRTKVVVVNYPNNPTGACATREFFSKLVELAHENSFLIVNDAAYSALTFRAEDRLSIFNVDGAMDVALELHSMSKGFNMSGWRIGWVCGNESLVGAYAHVKDQSDSGQFLAIQKAAAQTLNNLFIPANNARKYCERMEQVAIILQNCGFDVEPAKAGFFMYARSPVSIEYSDQRISFQSAENFAEWLIENLGIVVVPWDDVEPSLRFSMTFAGTGIDESEIIDIFRDRMSNVRFKFRG